MYQRSPLTILPTAFAAFRATSVFCRVMARPTLHGSDRSIASSMIGAGRKGVPLGEPEIRALCSSEIARWSVRGKRVLAIVPDATRTAPMGSMFRLLHEELTAQG